MDEDVLEALRCALVQRLREPTNDRGVREALRAVSCVARARGMHAEQVVIALKQVWESLPDVRSAVGREERLHALDRLVTLCIDAYYLDDG